VYCKTPEVAYNTYKSLKNDIAKSLASKYEGVVNLDVLKALHDFDIDKYILKGV